MMIRIAAAALLMVAAGCNPRTSDPVTVHGRLDRIERTLKALWSASDEIKTRLDSADAHLAESARVAHDRRKALADELRREVATEVELLRWDLGLESMGLRRDVVREAEARKSQARDLGVRVDQLSAAVGHLRSAVEAERGTRGQQILAERSQRQRDLGRLADETSGVIRGQIAVNAELEARSGSLAAGLDHLRRRLKAVEDRPVPPPTVIEKTVQVPVYWYWVPAWPCN